MARFALRLAYDGTAFAGWWRQPGRRTVAGVLDEALVRLGEAEAAPVGAARTDAGVHAHGQVAHVDLVRAWQPGRLCAELNAHLPPDAACTGVAAVDAAWHATHAATGKTYRYCIDAGLVPDPFASRTSWRPPFASALRVGALQAAARAIPLGVHDWSAFRRRGETRADRVRRLDALSCAQEGHRLVLRLSGDGFIYRQVRSLVGALVAVAHDSLRVEALTRALAGEVGGAARQQAPARGLHLDAIAYAEPPAWITPAQARARSA